MPRFLPKARHPLRILVALMSFVLFAYLIWQAGPSRLWENVVKLGWGFMWVLALAGVSHVARAWAWRLTLDDHKHKTSFLRLLGLRLGAEAAGQFGFIGQTFGDSIRVSQLSPEIPIANGLASVTLDRGLYILTGMIVLIAGLVAAVPLLSHSHALRFYATLFVLALIFFLLVTLLAVRKRWPVISRSARLLARAPFLKRWMESRYILIQSVENAFLDFHHNSPRAFWGSFFLILASHCMAVMEVCLVLWLMGIKFGVLSALVVEAMTKLVNVVGSINPGNFGTYEGGNMLIGKTFGLTGATGLVLGLTRRLRGFFWAAVGGICLFILTRSRTPHDTHDRGGTPGIAEEKGGAAAEAIVEIAARSSFAAAIFLPTAKLGNEKFGGLARVGSLPILLRNILAVRKLGPSRIMVVVDPLLRRHVQRQLWWTGRLPESVQWIEAKPDVSVLQLSQLIAAQARSERLVIMDGGTTYHASLLQKAKEWNDESVGLALKSGDEDIGIYAFAAKAICDCQKGPLAQVVKLQELLAPVTEIHPVTDIPVAEDLWQRVNTEENRQAAERKLDRWLVKPTDGIYARLNRRISIPISRQLIKLPITANMVTLFTLGVGLVSGIFFALGGYWNTLLGAVLCLWASILDGCDGEVARLKLLESDFGCWLETICDYLFYLILFVGMTIGLWRSAGSKTYLVAGGLLLFGAIATFLATAWERHRLAVGRPEQLLKIWQGHAESRASNPFLFIGRHLEFIIRRCFFPYALLFFALFHIMNVAFFIAALGANLVWPIALYSLHAFAGGRNSATAIPAASAQPRTSIRQYVPAQL
ncbi:MAG TPA: lysylphosphatidylglycerol synthase domain-containing protein [Candidatus Acidoferrum sp.]|nr:lysylphosphatidylglycerol synthase domain-containing protein [Candidatus Acidoferrum sp.]